MIPTEEEIEEGYKEWKPEEGKCYPRNAFHAGAKWLYERLQPYIAGPELIDAHAELASRLAYQENEVRRAYDEGYKHGQMAIELRQDEIDERIRRNWFGEP